MGSLETCLLRSCAGRTTARTSRQARALHQTTRSDTQAPTASAEKLLPFESLPVSMPPCTAARPLKNVSTPALLRSIMLSEVFARPRIATLGMKMLKRLTASRQPFLDPDRNWMLNRVLRATIYDHFCGGWKHDQIQDCLDQIKRVGYSGVILQYAREVVAHDLAESSSAVDVSAQQIQQWHEGNMQTLSMLGAGDYTSVKYVEPSISHRRFHSSTTLTMHRFTGAGGKIAEALKAGSNPPEQLSTALDELCTQAKAKGTRVMIDAEEQVYQPTIDRWAVDLMRRYNRDGDASVLNTYQAYLKSTPSVLHAHLRLAGQEGWALGVKLVRGAYILIETRSRIHDTKADTDACYDGILRDVLSRSAGDVHGAAFPPVRLLAAGHNAPSIRKATALRAELLRAGVDSGPLEFGQLYGMADHVSGELLAEAAGARRAAEGSSAAERRLQAAAAPRVLKCVSWGSVRECLGYLNRRAAENQGSADRLLDGLEAAKKELWARVWRRE